MIVVLLSPPDYLDLGVLGSWKEYVTPQREEKIVTRHAGWLEQHD